MNELFNKDKESGINVNINVGEVASSLKDKIIAWFKHSWIYIAVILVLIIYIAIITFHDPDNAIIDNAQNTINNNQIKIEQLSKKIELLNQKIVELEKKEKALNAELNKLLNQNSIDAHNFNNNIQQILNSSKSTQENIKYINNKYKKVK